MLLAILALHVAVQAGPPQSGRPPASRDSTVADSSRRPRRRKIPVTDALLASAFHDEATRALFNRARSARLAQDSLLKSYDAKVKQRMSVLLGIGKLGPERLIFRRESAARVQWQQGRGARIEITGGRVAIPFMSDKELRGTLESGLTDSEMSPIPYFPGQETLWVGDLVAAADVDETEIINPLAGGAEAYYTYESGQSVSFRLPDGHEISLREIKVRPRAAKANLAIGSLWFDTASGRLVRAAYRLAIPAGANIGVSDGDSVMTAAQKRITFLIGALVSPMVAELKSVVIEYGLYGGQFWLPRVQSMEGSMQAMFARIPVKFENAFTYASVNAPLDLPDIRVDTTQRDGSPELRRPPPGLDSASRRRWRDSTRAVYDAKVKARADSTKAGMRLGSLRQCDTSATRVITQARGTSISNGVPSAARVPVELRIPCDLDKLMASADLPKSIFDPGEEVFGSSDADRLISEALSMGAQAPLSLFALPRPRVQLGPSMTRYNRIEGFSTGLLVEQQLGGGYAATGIARLGAADGEPNVELSLSRSNLDKTIRLNGYNRLVAANDWGEPLSFRSSLAAFLFGRDEGFYYRASGAELLWTTEGRARVEWRAFAEQQRPAVQETDYSLGATFVPNIAASRGPSAGASMRVLHTYGDDPFGLRVFTDLRLEGAGGDSTYGRGALDLTLSRGLFNGVAAAVTLSGGSSVGQLPPQRRWFLGGTQTIRGQSPDTAQSGNAFWMGRVEIARGQAIVRPSIFADLGWTGDRGRMRDVGRPLSDVGIGLSFLDGMIRFDVARGLYPREQTRVSLYFGARF